MFDDFCEEWCFDFLLDAFAFNVSCDAKEYVCSCWREHGEVRCVSVKDADKDFCFLFCCFVEFVELVGVPVLFDESNRSVQFYVERVIVSFWDIFCLLKCFSADAQR